MPCPRYQQSVLGHARARARRAAPPTHTGTEEGGEIVLQHLDQAGLVHHVVGFDVCVEQVDHAHHGLLSLRVAHRVFGRSCRRERWDLGHPCPLRTLSQDNRVGLGASAGSPGGAEGPMSSRRWATCSKGGGQNQAWQRGAGRSRSRGAAGGHRSPPDTPLAGSRQGPVVDRSNPARSRSPHRQGGGVSGPGSGGPSWPSQGHCSRGWGAERACGDQSLRGRRVPTGEETRGTGQLCPQLFRGRFPRAVPAEPASPGDSLVRSPCSGLGPQRGNHGPVGRSA